jgi:Reverse transcriptase (RNA-dependent DNA polymerase).
MDQIFTLQQMLEKCWECNITVHLAFMDFTQAYDSVRREKMYEALQRFQIPNKTIRLVKETMDNTVAEVLVQTGVRER